MLPLRAQSCDFSLLTILSSPHSATLEISCYVYEHRLIIIVPALRELNMVLLCGRDQGAELTGKRESEKEDNSWELKLNGGKMSGGATSVQL